MMDEVAHTPWSASLTGGEFNEIFDARNSAVQADAQAKLAELPQSATLREGMVLYDIARDALAARSGITHEPMDSDSILRECNRIMMLNGYPDAQLEGKSNIGMGDLPAAWNGVSWNQEFKLYDDKSLVDVSRRAAFPVIETSADPEHSRGDASASPSEASRGDASASPSEASRGDALASPSEPEPAPAQTAPLAWDPELDSVNAQYEPVQGLNPGDKYWRLTGAEFLPAGNEEGQAGGRHHIYYRVKDENGNNIVGAGIAMGWPDGQSNDATKPDEGGLGNQPMYASFAPERGEKGPYSAWVTANGLPSDKVNGLGLPLNQHVAYVLTYELATWGQ
jgi:hypothetical protein